MHIWLRGPARSTHRNQSTRLGRYARLARRSKLAHHAERLEDRTLLSADSGAGQPAPAVVSTRALPGLSISNQAVVPSLNAGDMESYTVAVTNNTVTSQEFWITDSLAPGATNAVMSGNFMDGMVYGTTGPNGEVTLTYPFGLAVGQTATFDVQAALNTPGVAYNVASLTWIVGDTPILADATAVAFVNGAGAPANGAGTPVADLSITNTPSAATIGQDGTETYTLVVANTDGTNPSKEAVLTDVLPGSATNVTTSGPSGVTFTNNHGAVTAALGSLAPGASETLTITAKLANTGIAVNTANVEAATADDNQANNSRAATVIVTSPALLTFDNIGPASGTVGQPMKYTIAIQNLGGTPAPGATATDVLRAGLTLVSATDPQGTVVVNGNTITDTFGPLAGQSAPEPLIVTVIPTAALGGKSVTNTVTFALNGATLQKSAVTAIGEPQAYFLQSAPGDGTAVAEVTNLYWNLLGRAPDPVGLQGWAAYLQANVNAHGQQVLVSGFLNSSEYKAHYVTSLYAMFLGRAPDAAGLAYWTAKLGDPGTPGGATGSSDEKHVVAAILGSDEFYSNAGGTPQAWINALYEDLLGRTPQSGEIAFWRQELSTVADRDGIVSDILGSPEVAHDMLDMFYPAAGGAAITALPPPGSPAGASGAKLAELTGGGWENLYFSGPYGVSQEANDVFFAELVGGAAWDVVQLQMLTSLQYYNNPNLPQAHVLG